MPDKPEIIKAWCQQRLGDPYIYGATGQPCTPSYRKARMAQYPKYADKITQNCPRLSGRASSCKNCRWCDPETGKGKLAYDCAQLTKGAMAAAGISIPSGANSQWEQIRYAAKGKLATLPADRVAMVFRWDDDHMGHVGAYQGDGSVIHARGHAYGVVRQDLDKTDFTHWGIPKGLYEDMDKQIVDRPTLRRGDSGDNVVYLQMLLCESGQTLDADGKFGAKTEQAVRIFQQTHGLVADGIVGQATWQALVKASQPDPEPDPEYGHIQDDGHPVLDADARITVNILPGTVILGDAEITLRKTVSLDLSALQAMNLWAQLALITEE